MAARAAGGARCLVFFGLAVLTRLLLVGLLISVGALLFAAGAMVRHVLRQRRIRVDETAGTEAVVDMELEAGVQSAEPEPAALHENLKSGETTES